MDDYITKPITPQSLSAILDKWLFRIRKENPAEAAEIAAAEPLVWDYNGMLERLMDDKPLAKKIIDGFLSDIPVQMGKLEEFVDLGDAEKIERQAHSIKSAVANIGGEAMRAAALEMEEKSHEGNLSDAAELLSGLKTELQHLGTELAKRFTTL